MFIDIDSRKLVTIQDFTIQDLEDLLADLETAKTCNAHSHYYAKDEMLKKILERRIHNSDKFIRLILIFFSKYGFKNT